MEKLKEKICLFLLKLLLGVKGMKLLCFGRCVETSPLSPHLSLSWKHVTLKWKIKKKKSLTFMHYIPNKKLFQFHFLLRVIGKKLPSFVEVEAHFCTTSPQTPLWQSWNSDPRWGVTAIHLLSEKNPYPSPVWLAVPKALFGQSRAIHQGSPEHEGCKTSSSSLFSLPASYEDSYFRK